MPRIIDVVEFIDESGREIVHRRVAPHLRRAE